MDIQPHSTPERIESSIDEVTDSQGEPVPPNSTTEDTVLTLSGSGTASSIVFIFDNDVLLSPASVTINRTWNFTETVALGRHVFTVRDLPEGGNSPEWVVTVGEAELDLKEPSVSQAPTGILNPTDVINGATLVVTYAMQTTDTIGISWNGLDNLVPTQPGSTLGSVTFTIPASAVAPVIGKTIEVRYGVVRNGVSKPSQPLDLTVQTLPDAELEAPRILQATDDGSLDVSALTGDADLKVKPWPFIAEGQRISLRFEGTKADGTDYNWSHPAWQNLPISSTGEPSTTVALSSLKELKDGSNLTLVFDVSFDGGLTQVLFPARTLSVIQGVGGYEGFETLAPMEIPRRSGIVIPETGVRLTSLGGTYLAAIARAGNQQGEHGFQYVSVAVNSTGHSVVFIDLPAQNFKTISFTLWAVIYARNLYAVVNFLGPNYERLAYREVQIPPDGRVSETYTAPAGKYIYQISVEVGGGNGVNREVACDSIYWSE